MRYQINKTMFERNQYIRQNKWLVLAHAFSKTSCSNELFAELNPDSVKIFCSFFFGIVRFLVMQESSDTDVFFRDDMLRLSQAIQNNC